jgi:hypothetical protein
MGSKKAYWQTQILVPAQCAHVPGMTKAMIVTISNKKCYAELSPRLPGISSSVPMF